MNVRVRDLPLSSLSPEASDQRLLAQVFGILFVCSQRPSVTKPCFHAHCPLYCFVEVMAACGSAESVFLNAVRLVPKAIIHYHSALSSVLNARTSICVTLQRGHLVVDKVPAALGKK